MVVTYLKITYYLNYILCISVFSSVGYSFEGSDSVVGVLAFFTVYIVIRIYLLNTAWFALIIGYTLV